MSENSFRFICELPDLHVGEGVSGLDGVDRLVHLTALDVRKLSAQRRGGSERPLCRLLLGEASACDQVGARGLRRFAPLSA